MRFAHLKTHHGFNRLRLRGLSGARDAFHPIAIAQNLKTLARPTVCARRRTARIDLSSSAQRRRSNGKRHRQRVFQHHQAA
jgi:hypothetical protein